MEPQERIALTIQLPVEELGRFSQLLEQVRQLMADNSAAAGGSRKETAENASFDSAHFQALSKDQVSREEQTGTAIEEASTARAEFTVPEDALPPAELLPQAESPAAAAQPEEPLPSDSADSQAPLENAADGFSQEADVLPIPPAEGQELQAPAVPTAGYAPEVQLPEAPGSSWSGIREELTFPGPAPLTAEAVSQAFQRDDRRYDNGFPLY